MRMLMHLQFPLEPFNTAVRDGSAGQKIQRILEAIKPEAAYFTAVNGCRGGYIVFHLRHPDDIPSICEPFFNELDAKIELTPVMTPEEVQSGLAKAYPK